MKEIIESLNLPKQILDKTEKFMTTIFGPSAQEIGQLFADKVRFRRMKNQIKIFKKTVEILEANNLQAKELKLKTLVPLLEQSSLEEDELLQDKWANLIANISSSPENGLEPKLIKTLSNLSSLEASVLDFIYERFLLKRKREFKESQERRWMIYDSIDKIRVDSIIISFKEVRENFKLNYEFSKICIDNLSSLGLIKYEEPEIEIDNNSMEPELKNDEDMGQYIDFEFDVSANYHQSDDFHLTSYGRYFIEHCKENKNDTQKSI